MSNALRKRKKTVIGFNSADKKSLKRSMTTIRQENAILDISGHASYMTYMTLYAVFDFKARKLLNFYELWSKLKDQWSEDKITTAEMLTYCEKKKIDIMGFIKSIPISQKMVMIGKNTTKDAVKMFESSLLVSVIMVVIILKENYKFSVRMINEYFEKMKYYIDSYTRKQPGTNLYYLNDNMILEIFRDELKLDLITGEMVKE